MGVGGQHHAPAALPPGKTRYPLFRRLGRPQGRSGRVRKIPPPPGFDPRTVQPVASRYTDWAIPAHVHETHPLINHHTWDQWRRMALILLQVLPLQRPSNNDSRQLYEQHCIHVVLSLVHFMKYCRWMTTGNHKEGLLTHETFLTIHLTHMKPLFYTFLL